MRLGVLGVLLEVLEWLSAVVVGDDVDCCRCMLRTEEGEDERSFIDSRAIPRCPQVS